MDGVLFGVHDTMALVCMGRDISIRSLPSTRSVILDIK